jgi:choice-of-anchor A domain-containing protein
MRRLYILGLCLCGLLLLPALSNGQVLFNYNLFTTGNLTVNSTDISGLTMVGGNLSVTNMPSFANNNVSPYSASTTTLAVVGSVTGTGLTMMSGTFAHSGSLPGGFSLDLNNGAQSVTESVSDSSLVSQLNSTASYYNTLTGTSVSPSGGNLTFNVTGTGLKVFTTTEANMSQQNLNVNVDLSSNSNQAALIIVTGPANSSFTFGSSENMHLNGGNTSQVLWYFPDATSVSEQDSQWYGALFAPSAALTDSSQSIMGSVYVSTFDDSGSAQVEMSMPSSLFNAPVPEPTSIVLLGGLCGACGLLRPRRRNGRL